MTGQVVHLAEGLSEKVAQPEAIESSWVIDSLDNWTSQNAKMMVAFLWTGGVYRNRLQDFRARTLIFVILLVQLSNETISTYRSNRLPLCNFFGQVFGQGCHLSVYTGIYVTGFCCAPTGAGEPAGARPDPQTWKGPVVHSMVLFGSGFTMGPDSEPRRNYPRPRFGLDEGGPPLGPRGCAGLARSKRSSNGARSKRRMIACISSAFGACKRP